MTTPDIIEHFKNPEQKVLFQMELSGSSLRNLSLNTHTHSLSGTDGSLLPPSGHCVNDVIEVIMSHLT